MISQSRFAELKELINNKKHGVNFRDFTADEIKDIIVAQTCLTTENRKIAIDRYINRLSIYQLSEKYCLSESAIKNRIKKISNLLKDTCVKYFK